jgi:uncharacterized protein YraI
LSKYLVKYSFLSFPPLATIILKKELGRAILKKLIKLSISLIFLFSLSLPILTAAQAASSSSATVAATLLNVREKPSLNAKKVGSLKKGTKLTVYERTKSGWSEIHYKTKKAYVFSKYLKFTTKKASYLLDKTKVYTYKTATETYQLIPSGKKYNGWDKWTYSPSAGDKQVFIVRENSKGLYTGFIDSEYYIDIEYPVKVGQSWAVGYDEDGKARIISITKTVKTPAGTFKNCIEVKDDSGYITYYAKNIGMIKSIENGKTATELVRIKKK